MKDPIRLRDAKSPHARAARDLLQSAVGGRASGSGFSVRGMAGPSLEQRDAMWSSLVAAIGPVPPGGGSDGGDAGHGPDGADPATAVSGGDGLAASASASAATAKAASAAKVATASATKVATATAAAAPAGKAVFSVSAAKLWIAIGLGAAGSVGTAAYVASPARAPATHAAAASPPAAPPADAREGVRTSDAPVAAPAPIEARNEAPPEVQASPGDAKNEVTPRRAGSAKPSGATDTATSAAPAEPSAADATGLTSAERASRLRDEAKATAEARTALRSGDAAGALRLLAEAARTYGGGGMGQEREALTIEALARSGAREAAGARAEAFLARFPNSTYASTVRPFASGSNSK